MASPKGSFDTAVGELCTEILHAQKFEQSYFTGYYFTYCLRSPQLARGTEQTAQCQFTRPFSRAVIGKGSGYARPASYSLPDLTVGQRIFKG